MNKLKKIFNRIVRILTFNKNHYGKMGKKNKFGSYAFLDEYSVIGNYNYIGRNTICSNVVIGNYCSIGPNCSIGLGEHNIKNISTSNKIMNDSLLTKKAVIGNDVWIGCNSVVLQGVVIGDGAVIGAGSVVVHNVEDYTIVVGVPAQMLKNRFGIEKVKKIKSLELWTKKPSEIRRIISRNE